MKITLDNIKHVENLARIKIHGWRKSFLKEFENIMLCQYAFEIDTTIRAYFQTHICKMFLGKTLLQTITTVKNCFKMLQANMTAVLKFPGLWNKYKGVDVLELL